MPVRHSDRCVLVRNGQQPERIKIPFLRFQQPFHDRRKIGSGVHEHVFEAELTQPVRQCAPGDEGQSRFSSCHGSRVSQPSLASVNR